MTLAISALVMSCAAWQPAGGRLRSGRWCVTGPEGWMRLETDQYVMMSRDGPYLQYILIQQRPLSRPFRHARQSITALMLPHEAAGVVLDDLRADPAVAHLQVNSNKPAAVGRRSGFELDFTYQDTTGLTMRTLLVGLVEGQHFFSMRYTAPQRFYFDLDKAVFEKVRQTFSIDCR